MQPLCCRRWALPLKTWQHRGSNNGLSTSSYFVQQWRQAESGNSGSLLSALVLVRSRGRAIATGTPSPHARATQSVRVCLELRNGTTSGRWTERLAPYVRFSVPFLPCATGHYHLTRCRIPGLPTSLCPEAMSAADPPRVSRHRQQGTCPSGPQLRTTFRFTTAATPEYYLGYG